MSVLSSIHLPRLTPFHQRVWAVFQRFTEAFHVPRNSDWYSNASGNFAVRVTVISTVEGPQAWMTVRRGWHSGEYTYSRCSVPPFVRKVSLRKAYRLACRQAAHLAGLRYRFL